MSAPAYRRILLKLSGEALMGNGAFGIDPDVIGRLAAEIRELSTRHLQLALVIGGGNIFRGIGLVQVGIDRVTGDRMGMLATVMNALAMRDVLQRQGVPTRVLSALAMDQVCETYDHQLALRYLDTGHVVIFAAGTGNPYFTTDTAASLRAAEIGADLLIKATKVDGVYSSDPLDDPAADFYPRVTYEQVLRQDLKVMDATAVILCRDQGIPIRVMNIYNAGALMRLIEGGEVGSLVARE